MQEVYSTKQLATLFDKSDWTIRNWQKNGVLPEGIKISHRCRIWTRGELKEKFPSIQF